MLKMTLVSPFFMLLLLTPNADAAMWLETKCEAVQSNLDSIRQWTTSRSRKCDLSDPVQVNPANQLCLANVERCIPPEVLALQGTRPEVQGPNCWNLAMVMSGVLPARRYSSPEEMAFFMNSPLCRTLGANEKRQPGDLGAYRAGPNEVHGFMWISDEVVLSKNGMSKVNPYALQTFEGMNEMYKNVQKIMCKAYKNQPCDLTLDTVRCQSLDSYLENPEHKVPKEIKEAFIRLEHAENCLSGLQMKPDAYTAETKRNIVDSLKVVASVFESPEFKESLKKMDSKEQKFVEQSLFFRLHGMSKQMGFHREERFCRTCHLATLQIRRSAEAIIRR